MTTIDTKMFIEKLQKAGGHFAYSKSRRHPSTKPFLYTTKNSKDIINLESTAKQLQDAATFLAGLLAEKKQIVFIGSKPEAREKVKNAGIATSMPYVYNRFIGGSLTNFSEIKKRIDKLLDLTAKKEKGELSIYTKKEQMLIGKDIERMNKNFGGLIGITGVPAAIVLVDAKYEEIALTEAKYLRVPVVALSNSDCNIRGIQYPIVVNEASTASVGVVLETLVKALESATA